MGGELLSCPFCGSEAAMRDAVQYNAGYFVSCSSCFCCVGEGYDRDAMPEHMFPTEEAAAEAWNRRASPPPPSGSAWGAPLQARVKPWMDACFGPEISGDKLERGDRLLEEVFELLQSGEYPRERVRALEEYTWARPKGEPAQEVGGVMITLAAYCLAHGIDMHEAGETELARIWTKVDKIRAKQAAKPVGSALPIPSALSPSPSYAEGIEAAAKVVDGISAAYRISAGAIQGTGFSDIERKARAIEDLADVASETAAAIRELLPAPPNVKVAP